MASSVGCARELLVTKLIKCQYWQFWSLIIWIWTQKAFYPFLYLSKIYSRKSKIRFNYESPFINLIPLLFSLYKRHGLRSESEKLEENRIKELRQKPRKSLDPNKSIRCNANLTHGWCQPYIRRISNVHQYWDRSSGPKQKDERDIN